jgi:predicted nucleic acid-binding protein
VSFTAVIDNSALVEYFVNPSPNQELVKRILTGTLVAPELLDAEALSVVRRLQRHQVLTADEALGVLGNIHDAPIVRVSHRPLLDRAWAIRHAVSAYDSLYLALAEWCGVPLVTCDARLAGSHGHRAEIELHPVS